MDIQRDIQEIQAIAGKQGLKLKGHITVDVFRGKTGITERLVDQPNTIQDALKDAIRDSLHAAGDFALNNLQAAQIEGTPGSTPDGKDGILIFDAGATTYDETTIKAFMASAVHPSAPTGDSPFFRQWQGVYQNGTGGNVDVDGIQLGWNYANDTAPAEFFDVGVLFAQSDFTNITLADTDIITVNWKITVG